MKSYIVFAIWLLSWLVSLSEIVQAAQPDIKIDKTILYSTVQSLTEIKPARSYANIESLNKAADFIKNQFADYGYTPIEQKYNINNVEYKNIIASYGSEKGSRFVVGAHYDVCGDQPGADDNASGIAGLLYLARLLKEYSPNLDFGVELVAYSLEEPPFFKTEAMGSFIHAKSLHDGKVKVLGMLSLEMIGFYSDAPKSQKYPLPLMKLFYPRKGNFIAVVGNYNSSALIKHFRKNMKNTAVKVKSLKAPSFVAGIDFSDHLNYWKFDYRAIMLTDTAFLRNPNYHEVSDSIDTLNFDKMQGVVKGVYWAITSLKIN